MGCHRVQWIGDMIAQIPVAEPVSRPFAQHAAQPPSNNCQFPVRCSPNDESVPSLRVLSRPTQPQHKSPPSAPASLSPRHLFLDHQSTTTHQSSPLIHWSSIINSSVCLLTTSSTTGKQARPGHRAFHTNVQQILSTPRQDAYSLGRHLCTGCHHHKYAAFNVLRMLLTRSSHDG